MSALKIIQALGRKIAAKKSKTPEGITQIQPQIYAESEASNIAQTLIDAGLPMERFDEFIFSEADVVRLLNQIKALEKKNLAENIRSGIRNTESAKVFDLKGKRIKDTDNIMGGEEMPPPGSRGGKDDIAAPVMNVEDAPEGFIDFVRKTDPKAADKLQKAEDDIRAKIEAGNKRYLDKIKKQKEEGTYKRYNPEEGSKLDLEIKEEYQKAIRGESKLMKGKFKGTEEDFRDMIDEMTDDFANGGRVGLKEGSGMSRRTFLKLLGGAMAIPIVGKILKPFKIGKKVAQVPIIKTDDVAGKPEWFDQLVNKVILEGDDVTKRFATKDREIVHMKKIDDDNTVMVYQDLDEGAVRVDYDAPSNMGEDTVSLQYKKPLPDEGDPRPKAEFEASELEPRYVGGPEDADIEFDGLGGGSSIKMLESDVSKLKEYATGQKQTLKEFIESKKRKDRVDAINRDQLEQAEYISGKYGDGPEPDFDDIEDFARGGIARMLGE